MPRVDVDSAARRRSLVLPTLAFAALALGCATDAVTGAGDELVAADEAANDVAAQEAAAPSSDDWPEKCDAVYRITVDNDGKSPKQQIPPGSEIHPQVFVDAPWGNEDVQALACRPITDKKKILHHWIAYANNGGFAFMTGWASGQDDSQADKLLKAVSLYLPMGPHRIRVGMSK